MLRRREVLHKKGFTLVEVIVVLVILAILGTMTVPALTGQLRSGQEKKAVTEAQACVAAATDLAAQKYTAARTDYLNDNTKPIAAALNAWAGKVQDDGPEVTGDLILTEGTGQYLLEPTNADTGAAVGSSSVKQAAGVDGTVLNFWCNANGQVVYLLYKSADGITVAYTNQATSGTGSVVIPTANVPTAVPGPTPTKKPDSGTDTPTPMPVSTPTKTPSTDPDTPATPDPGKSEGNLIIHIVDAVTGKDIPGISLTVKGVHSDVASYSHTLDNTDKGGYAYVPVVEQRDMSTHPDALGQYYSYRVFLTNSVSGYQDFLETQFSCNLKGTIVTAIANNYANGESASGNILTIPLYPVASITLKKTDTSGQPLADAFFTVSSADDSQSVTVKTDKSGEASLSIKLHALDGAGATALDLTSGGNIIYNVKEITAPSGYVAHDDFKFKLNVGDPASAHDFEFHWTDGNAPSGVNYESKALVSADNSYSSKWCSTHTLTVKNEVASPSNVTITKLKSNSDEGVSNAELVLYNEKKQEVARWTTTGTQSSHTLSLMPGSYTLHESNVPSKYLQAADISFTIKNGETSREIKMFDPTIETDKTDSPVASKDYNIVFKAENWANKLAYDGQRDSKWALKLAKEVLLWKGELYYNYLEISGIPNPDQDAYKKYFEANGVMPPNALDPIAHIDKYKTATMKSGSSYVVKLTGKICSWKEGSNLFNKGDLLIAYTGSKYKAFVYLGNDGSTISLGPKYTKDDDLTSLNFSQIGEKYVTITPIN